MIMAGQAIHHLLWLASIQDIYIIGLQLLGRWGATVDVPRTQLLLGTEAVALQAPGEDNPSDQRGCSLHNGSPESFNTESLTEAHRASPLSAEIKPTSVWTPVFKSSKVKSQSLPRSL